MPSTRKEILEERRRLKADYGKLFDRIAALLFRRDPEPAGRRRHGRGSVRLGEGELGAED